MDAVTRISSYFPSCSITGFWIISNLIVNNSTTCSKSAQQGLSALLAIFCILVVIGSFTDSYTASNGLKYVVLLVPLYGPLCFYLPSDFDKDRVYEFYYLKVRDYVHAFTSMTAFLLVTIFITPISICLYPSGNNDGNSRIDPAVVRTVPIVAALMTSLTMMCLGPPRQILGFSNVDETCPLADKQMEINSVQSNPIYKDPIGPGSPFDSQMPGEEDDDEGMPPPSYNSAMGRGGMYNQQSQDRMQSAAGSRMSPRSSMQLASNSRVPPSGTAEWVPPSQQNQRMPSRDEAFQQQANDAH